MQPYSFFVCYHVPTDTLRFCSVGAVIQRYEHGPELVRATDVTVIFSKVLTVERLKSLALG